ncbi:MAG: hypothetical protein GY795_13190 [Desulfobacterales bacterium]|nr:hypothetical protein [Desulfobacterales bacterium]
MKYQSVINRIGIITGILLTLVFLLPNSVFSYDLEAFKAIRRLREFGYIIPHDGCDWGEKTQKALEQFQLIEGVKNIGFLDETTKKLLHIDSLRVSEYG